MTTIAQKTAPGEAQSLPPVERAAALAFEMGYMEPEHTEGPGTLLRRMMGPGGIELIDVGSPGVARMDQEIRACPIIDRGVRWLPRRVWIARRQRCETLALAAATGCALFVALQESGRTDAWSPSHVADVALAILLPAAALRQCIDDGATVEDLAWCFVTDKGLVERRLEMLTVGSSGVVDLGWWKRSREAL